MLNLARASRVSVRADVRAGKSGVYPVDLADGGAFIIDGASLFGGEEYAKSIFCFW
jgi:hypothetical protein